ncbi:MAG: hypothetical protein LBH43_18335 [Treponema sp.]|jgi:hypothetical protein|nr:hypothetical protein [Treponema sp.]
MKKNGFVASVLVFVVAGWAFAQTDFETMPKNTITLDFGPTIIGAAIGEIGKSMDEGQSSSGFGFAAQYERQMLERVSVGGRFAYLGGGFSSTAKEGVLEAVLELKLSSFSLEGHARYYPFGKTFFLDSMLGYASMSVKFSGELIGTDEGSGLKVKEEASLGASRGFFKYGIKLGWRINFGRDGGFTFEPSFGYYGGAGLGDTMGKKLSAHVKDIELDLDGLDDMFAILEDYIFIGGPRFALAFGWRF